MLFSSEPCHRCASGRDDERASASASRFQREPSSPGNTMPSMCLHRRQAVLTAVSRRLPRQPELSAAASRSPAELKVRPRSRNDRTPSAVMRGKHGLVDRVQRRVRLVEAAPQRERPRDLRLQLGEFTGVPRELDLGEERPERRFGSCGILVVPERGEPLLERIITMRAFAHRPTVRVLSIRMSTLNTARCPCAVLQALSEPPTRHAAAWDGVRRRCSERR